ncbi:hypothetical protein ABPG75_000630 [Micractinium tetrahymenae]
MSAFMAQHSSTGGMTPAPAASPAALPRFVGRAAAAPAVGPALSHAAAEHAAADLGMRHTQHCIPQRLQQRRLRRWLAATPSALPPGLESAATGGTLLEGLQGAIRQHAVLYALEAVLAGAAAYAAAVWPSRPRGWAFKELVAVGPSQVAGKGVFAVVTIAAGTVLGAYPGRPRTPAEMAYKCATAPGARDYAFKTRDGRLLDPTDAAGQLSSSSAPGLPWLPIDFSLAYINEPPKGAGGTNVTVEDDPSDPAGLLCVAARDIYPGEELFMDYGPTYDRSRYAADVAAGPTGGAAAGKQGPPEGGEQRAGMAGAGAPAAAAPAAAAAAGTAWAAAVEGVDWDERPLSEMEQRCSMW